MEKNHDNINLALLPFDVLSLIIPQIELLDIARLRLVSKAFHQTFADDDICRIALRKLVPTAPESQVPRPSRAEFDTLIARCARWRNKKPSKIELIAAAKYTSAGIRAWGVAGDLLVYQSPYRNNSNNNHNKECASTSQLGIRDLRNVDPECKIDLGSFHEDFQIRGSDEKSKWGIWIPQIQSKGDSFICGAISRPSNILVSSAFHLSDQETPSQTLAVVSLEESTFGKVICHWRSQEEISFVAVNKHYVAYVTKEQPKKYRIGTLPCPTSPTVHWTPNEVPDIVKVYAFRDKEISSFGADISGRYLFVGFGFKHHWFQIVDVTNGACLKKIILPTPALEEYVSLSHVKLDYQFYQPVERKDSRGQFVMDAELICRYEQRESMIRQEHRLLNMARWRMRINIPQPSVVEDVMIETSFVGARPARSSSMSTRRPEIPSIEEQSKCFTVARAHVPSRQRNIDPHFRNEQKRSTSWFPTSGGLSFLISTLYYGEPEKESSDGAISPEDIINDSNSTTTTTTTTTTTIISATTTDGPRWLHPISSVKIPTASESLLSRRSSDPSRSQNISTKPIEIPPPTSENCELHIGPGWMVFAKDRTVQRSRIERWFSNRPSDELVVIRFD